MCWNAHRTVYRLFPEVSLDLRKYRIFGEYAHVVQSKHKSKDEQRAMMAQYLLAVNDSHYRVMIPTTGQVLLRLAVNYRLYNPFWDLRRLHNPIKLS